jgi:outer membrane protein TolC
MRLIIAFFVLIMPLQAYAEELINKDESLTLERCIEIGLKKHPSVVAAKYTIDVNQNRVGEAKSNYYPQLSSISGYNRYWDGLSDENYSTSLSLNQNIYDFGKTAAQVNIQKFNLNSAQADFENTSNQIIFSVKQTYYGLLETKRNRDVAQETVMQFDQHLKQAKGFYQAGTRAKFDVTRAEVDLSNSKLSLIKAENALRLAKVSLNNAIGLPYAPEYQIEDNLDFAKYALPLEEAVERAYDNRADLQSLLAKKKAAAESIELAKKGYYPTLSGSASYTWVNEDISSQKGWKVGASFTIPLFSGFLTTYQVQEYEANLKVLNANEESLRQSILLDIQQAYLNLREAEERISNTQLTVKQAQENLDLVNGRYMAGIGNPIEVTDAQVSYSNAKTAYNQALYDYKIAQASIVKAMGEK